jgi:hypothetical protein
MCVICLPMGLATTVPNAARDVGRGRAMCKVGARSSFDRLRAGCGRTSVPQRTTPSVGVRQLADGRTSVSRRTTRGRGGRDCSLRLGNSALKGRQSLAQGVSPGAMHHPNVQSPEGAKDRGRAPAVALRAMAGTARTRMWHGAQCRRRGAAGHDPWRNPRRPSRFDIPSCHIMISPWREPHPWRRRRPP